MKDKNLIFSIPTYSHSILKVNEDLNKLNEDLTNRYASKPLEPIPYRTFNRDIETADQIALEHIAPTFDPITLQNLHLQNLQVERKTYPKG